MANRIFFTSIPKAGTHLVTATFERLGYRTVPLRKGRVDALSADLNFDGDVLVYGHWRYNGDLAARLNAFGYHVVVLVRDPRDICLSMADFQKAGRPASVDRREPSIKNLGLTELVKGQISGYSIGGFIQAPITKTCSGWIEWAEKGALLLRFETLCSSATQRTTIPEIGEVGVDPAAFLEAVRASYQKKSGSVGENLNRGLPLRWKTDFDEGLRAFWTANAGGLADRLGYDE